LNSAQQSTTGSNFLQITSIQKEILIGLCLGDLTLATNPTLTKVNAKMELTWKSLDYIVYLINIFGNVVSSPTPKKSYDNKGALKSYYFFLKNCPDILR
jgi:hypothetical protein